MQTLLIDPDDLSSHIGIYSDTGGGKSLTIKHYCAEVERRKETAIIWDPDREYARAFRTVGRGDWILDPSVEECPYWAFEDEVRDEAEAVAYAQCLFPDRPDLKDPYWNNTARQVFSWLHQYHRPSTAEMGYWMAHPKQIDKRVKGTELETILTNASPQARAGVLGHLNLAAQPLRMMPARPDGRRRFTIREWCEKRDSWIFITSKPEHMAAMKPIHTMWLASLLMRIISMGKRKDLRRTHIIFEEKSSLTIQEFHLALVRARKTGCPIVYAIQNFADLKVGYGDKAETIFSQPKRKILFRTSNADSAKKLEATIGQKVVWRLEESLSTGRSGRSRSWHMRKEREPLIPAEEIMNWEDREGVILQPGLAVRIKIPIIDLPDREPAIVERAIPPMEKRPLDLEETEEPEAPPPPSKPRRRLGRRNPTLVVNVPAGPPDEYLVALAQNAARLAAEAESAGVKTEDYEGPPLTRFICAACKTIAEFDGALEEPTGHCLQCGGEFYAIPGQGYARNTVMKPRIKPKSTIPVIA